MITHSILVLNTEMEYETALRWVERNFNMEVQGTPDSDMMETLVDAIVDYEERHFDIGDSPDV